jgi:hypothetical protein
MISTPAKEGRFQAAKWLKIQMLVDAEELASLMQAVGVFSIYPLAGSLPIDAFPMLQESYLAAYGSWIEELKAGGTPTSFGSLTLAPRAAWKTICRASERAFFASAGAPDGLF